MLKKLFCSGFLTAVFSAYAQIHFPLLVEIDNFRLPLAQYEASVNPQAWTVGKLAFYQSPELIPFFAFLQEEYHIESAIETGTWKGETTSLFSVLFKQVHTIEALNEHFEIATNNLKQFRNVHCHLGSSEKVLEQILPPLTEQRVLFYLDAHWQSYWPLRDELEAISKTHKNNCIIVVDDIRVPTRPDIEYDKYGGMDCSYEYIEDKLEKIFTDYTIHYLIPRHICARAKLIIIPKQWK